MIYRKDAEDTEFKDLNLGSLFTCDFSSTFLSNATFCRIKKESPEDENLKS